MIDLVDRHDLGVAKRRRENLADRVERRLEPLPRGRVVADDDRQVGRQPRERLGPADDATATARSPRWPALASRVPPVTNSQPSTRSAGRRTSSTWGARTHRLAASIAVPFGCLPKSARRRGRSRAVSDRRDATRRTLAGLFQAQRRSTSGPRSDASWRYNRPSGLSFAAGGPDFEQRFKLLRQPLPLVRGRRRLPPGQQRAGRDHSLAGPSLVGLGVEMPDAGVAVRIGVRIAREHVGRNLPREVPARGRRRRA